MITSGSGRPPQLLVVDDQESNLKTMGEMLGRVGFKVIVARTAEAALEKLECHPIDLILLDVLMPGRDGFETCAAIRAEPLWTDIPIIFLSAADDKGLIVRALEVGGVDYVTKPFNEAELVSRVRTHVALKSARDALKEVAEDKDELLGILAHDLKNHLGGMKMSVHLLHARAAKQEDVRLKQMAANIHIATEQMYAFVLEFLANSAADRGWKLKTEPLWLHDITNAAVQRYQEAAQRKNITLEHFGSAAGPVAGDRKALDQIFDNLISNALKFSQPATRVRIQIDDNEGAVGGAICRVRDEGPGFSDEDKRQMFTRYQRLSALPTSGEPSTGLGLSIVRKLVGAMGGDITCDSRSGEGTTFVLRFNAGHTETPPRTALERSDSAAS
jgi:two-component system, sensor histidine kinase and response regulator